ncbi:Alpha/Beta hydrolase fold [Arabidopsis thaliana x Arabidopsis arenosa]|uniref:Alpha/Beta hydrolase fold n=2 Tax=Arabidopsis TaxID=3701 RepID=A0A8T2C4L9_9BRAS|nr:Alpha/Beta hydrolase fold [Arabidopsis thaliana x Arabidopsis arenosa]
MKQTTMETHFHKLQYVPHISLDYKVSPFHTFSFFKVSFPITKKRISCNKANKLRMDSSQGISATTQQKIVIPNSNNEKLVGLLHETGSTEIVVLCHGFRSTKNDLVMKNVAAAIEKEGISAFRFDFSGNGESEGSFYFGNYNYEADDLHSVIRYFTNMNRVVPIIIGHSKGGDVVLVYASKYHDIHNVINLSGRYDLKEGIGQRLGEDFLERIKQQGFIDIKEGNSGFRVTEKSLMERLNTDMHEACLKIDKECRVLTVHGSADEVIPLEDAKEFAKIIPNHKLEIVEGADHCYTKHQSQLVTTVMEFIKTVIVKKN